MTRRARAIALLVVAPALAVACGDDGGESAPETTEPSVTVSTGSEVSALSSYDDLAALRQAIVDDGRTCELEYEGLEEADKTLSICVIDGEQATLTIWTDPSTVQALVEADLGLELVAYGANWTIDVATPELAASLAETLGGSSG